MSGAYIPDIYNDNCKHIRRSLDRRLQSDDGEGSTLHDLVGDMSLNPEQLLIEKEELIAEAYEEALEINDYYS